MSTVLIITICLLTCLFAASVVVCYVLMMRLIEGDPERAVRENELSALLRKQTAEHAKQLNEANSKWMQILETAMEENKYRTSEYASSLREAVRVAWSPVAGQPSPLAPQQPIMAPTLPYPIAGDARLADDSDWTDTLMSETGLGRNEGAVIADDVEGGLIQDGKFLGVPGLVPPRGVVDDQTRNLLIAQSAKLSPVPSMLGAQPSATIPTTAQPPGRTGHPASGAKDPITAHFDEQYHTSTRVDI